MDGKYIFSHNILDPLQLAQAQDDGNVWMKVVVISKEERELIFMT